jgi:hypothetical protein
MNKIELKMFETNVMRQVDVEPQFISFLEYE